MKRIRYAWLGAMAMVICWLSIGAWSETPSNKNDVRLLIDISGSMKLTDPTNLRRPAVDLLVRLLPKQGRGGIWSFGEGVQVLVPYGEVDDGWLASARGQANSIASTGLYTNIGAALENAAFDAEQPASGHARHIILLTDGMVDIAKDPAVNHAEWHRIVNEVLPRLKQAGFKVHTIGLSDKADADLLKKLSLSTDGTTAVVGDAEGLMAAFLAALESAAPAEQLPLDDNRFLVDSSVEEFTALVFRAEPDAITQLMGPDQQRYSAETFPDEVRWHRAGNYDLITVHRPLEGEWQLLANLAPGSRVTVVSDLSLRVKSLPNNLVRGESLHLSFAMQQDGQALTDAAFLQLLDVSLSLDSDGAERQAHRFDTSAPPSNGIFEHSLAAFDEMGKYTLQLTVDGKSFKRSFTHRINVRHPFAAHLAQTQTETGEIVHRLEVTAQSEQILPQSTQVVATVTGMDRRRLVRPLTFEEVPSTWSTNVPTSGSGDYVIDVKVTGEDAQGTPFNYQLDPLVLNINPDALFAPQASPVVPATTVDQPAPAASEQVQPENSEHGDGLDEPAAPKWAWYGSLALGNLLLLAGGLWFIRRLVRSGGGDEVAPVPTADAPAASSAAPEEASTYMAMEPMEEEPPMEDFDAHEHEKDDEPVTPANPEVEATPAADDFGLDDLEDELMAQIAADTDDDDRLFEAGQDQNLTDDEDVDSMISSLIDDMEPSEPDEDELDAAKRSAAGG